jgi:hypothetical protein
VKILHAFADHGTESETLQHFGDVVRASINPQPNGIGDVVRVDCSDPDTLPFADREFDLAMLHPPCTRWATATNNAGTHDQHPNLVDEARTIGKRYAEHYVIENVPKAPLQDPVVLDGRMFGLPMSYERAFETSFDVEQPARNARLGNAETSVYYYSEKPHAWWASVKGLPPGKYPVEETAKNATPLAYLHHVLRGWIEATDETERPDYTNYSSRMDTRQRELLNESLETFAN